MSASDKTKLNGIENNANNYTLPAASGSTLGGVKTGSNITNSNGTISLSKTNVTSALGYTPPTTNTTYSTGTASYSGTTKLYTGTGTNTDGTMTQKAINTALSGKASTDLSNLSAVGEAKIANIPLTSHFTIIYPNGGTKANPANISNNNRYVEPNPFPGYYVNCAIEIKYNGYWGNPGGWTGSSGVASFAEANQLNDDTIIVIGGLNYLTEAPTLSGCPIPDVPSGLTSLPCRVKVWKVGKIPT
jgi:hypothetical protein